MHQEKHKLLGTVPGLAVAVVRAAAGHGVSADEVAHASQGRDVSPAARAAFGSLTPDHRRALSAIQWPFDCPSCSGVAQELIACTNTECAFRGCEACALPGLCKGCRRGAAERAEELQRKKARAAATGA